MEPALGKMDIVKLLRATHGLNEVLEISTPTTGSQFAAIARERPVVHRLVYRCTDQTDDGQPYHFRCTALDTRQAIRAIRAANQWRSCYDVVFVDPYHTYDCSLADLMGAYALLRPGGIMVIHDCNPPDASIARSTFQAGGWCGVTYWAFIDFVLRRWDTGFVTVDTDFGCGVIYKHPARGRTSHADRAALRRVGDSWRAARQADDAVRFLRPQPAGLAQP